MTSMLEVQRLLASITTSLVPWHVHEETAQSLLKTSKAFLGGDGLRPYIVFEEGDSLACIAEVHTQLPLPPLIQRFEKIAGETHRTSAPTYYLHGSLVDLAGRLRHRYLQLPMVHLVHLADNQRYQKLRLPLGVARLAQWLRFTNVARVQVTDYSTEKQPLGHLERAIVRNHIDIIGVSVNFGQRTLCETIASLLKRLDYRGIVVVGNILPAKSPEEFADLFHPIRTRVATSLGEIPLAALCENLIYRRADDAVDGLLEPRRRLPLLVRSDKPQKPDFVFPDDGVVGSIIAAGGQLSLETSIGCNFGKCTFCPRDHRGHGWNRLSTSSVTRALRRIASAFQPGKSVVSFVDEEFFGAEGLSENQSGSTAEAILETCLDQGIRCEIYTRAEQLFSRAQSLAWNLERAALLSKYRSCIDRVFIGVESGSSSQLKRYGKGQTPESIFDSLRIGSLLGVPMEFGFITFDPLLRPNELAENLNFLSRSDVFFRPATEDAVASIVSAYYLGGHGGEHQQVPLFSYVAYLATELEVLIGSSYARMLTLSYPQLLLGETDPNFARVQVRYADERIAMIAAVCRCWTEGMFLTIYRERLKVRTEGLHGASDSRRLLSEYRVTTVNLLHLLCAVFLPAPLSIQVARPTTADIPTENLPLDSWLQLLQTFGLRCLSVCSGSITSAEIVFDAKHLFYRRGS